MIRAFVAALLIATVASAQSESVVLEERLDLYGPISGAFLGSERTTSAPDGRRLRLVVTDASGAPTLRFFILHDDGGRETGAVYFEGDDETAYRETFTYDGQQKTTTYGAEPGEAAARLEADLEAEGRERRKRYFRADGSKYGEEDVLWNDDGTAAGWDFRRLGRDGAVQPERDASFRYDYLGVGDGGTWSVRVRSRDGEAERVEARTLSTLEEPAPYRTAASLAPGVVSTAASETSPSVSADGRVLAFARYGDDWVAKTPYVARLGADGWRVEPVPALGTVYNLAVTPDGDALIAALGPDGPLVRVRRDGDGWTAPEDLTARYGVTGAYPSVTAAGDLLVYRNAGAAGDGVYRARQIGEGFGPLEPLYVPASGTTFDAVAAGDGLLVTRCADETCAAGPANGVFAVDPPSGETRLLDALGYVWGVQPVAALGLLVFTDGDDIRAIPLAGGTLSP